MVVKPIHNNDLDMGEQVINESVSSEDISFEDIDWDEPFELEENSKDWLKELVDINWDEDVFSNDNVSSIEYPQHSMEFSGNYHFSEEMLTVLHTKFGLETFRPGQREIINAILNGHDCFVLMPTGGGKSLCFQLPALLSKGVTIVISPLIALIGDQVDKLNALDIRAAHLCSTISSKEFDEILSKLYLDEPEIDLLYLTPEKIMKSDQTRAALDSLYKRGKLSRFVMDEVHCLSLWGHDFRPDYKQLSMLRERYNDIQIICFTATATKQVENDVIVNLKLRSIKKFVQSFNRPNIKYQVIDKVELMPYVEIATMIHKKFSKNSGIIYCLARKDCEFLSQCLNSFRITAKPYHAGLGDEVRRETQRQWMQNQFQVIVATIAFGMGIDKPDVRFVIHNTIPKSLEAYYQESGRAGRDGETSYSYLFYNYDDVLRTMHVMRHGHAKEDTLDGHFDNLDQMVAFAINQVDCRRYLQLLNLGESFDRQLCIQNRETTCDNCENFNRNRQNEVDITKQAKELSILVKEVTESHKVTLNMVMKIYRGSKDRNIDKKKFNYHRFYGSGRLLSRLDVHRILTNLVVRNVLANDYIKTGGFPLAYIKPGAELETFLSSSDIKLTIPVAGNRTIQFIEPVIENGVERYINRLKARFHESLLELCQTLAFERNVSVASILHPLALKLISQIVPVTKEELLKIQHVTIAIFNKIGEHILRMTRDFKRQIQAVLDEARSSNEQSSSSDSERSLSSPLKRTYVEAFTSDNNNGK